MIAGGGWLLFRWVDPGCGGQFRWLRGDALEAQRMSGEGGIECDGALSAHCRGGALVHGSGGHQADAAVAMFEVVPGKEPLAVRAGVLDRAEPLRKVGPVLQGLELRLEARIIIRDMRAAVGLGHVQIDQQRRDGL